MERCLALDPNFKVPSQIRATLSGNYRANLGPLGDNWNIGGDILLNRVRNAIFVRDGRDRPITGPSALTPDGRAALLRRGLDNLAHR